MGQPASIPACVPCDAVRVVPVINDSMILAGGEEFRQTLFAPADSDPCRVCETIFSPQTTRRILQYFLEFIETFSGQR